MACHNKLYALVFSLFLSLLVALDIGQMFHLDTFVMGGSTENKDEIVLPAQCHVNSVRIHIGINHSGSHYSGRVNCFSVWSDDRDWTGHNVKQLTCAHEYEGAPESYYEERFHPGFIIYNTKTEEVTCGNYLSDDLSTFSAISIMIVVLALGMGSAFFCYISCTRERNTEERTQLV